MADPSPSLDTLIARVQADPKSRVFLQLAEAYRRQGQVEQALAVLDRGLGQQPSYLAARVAQGRCQLELGRLDEAQGTLERVLERDATQLVANKLLVKLHLEAGDPDAASNRLDLYSLLNDGDPVIEELRLEIQQARKQPSAPTPPPVPSSPSLPAAAPEADLAGTQLMSAEELMAAAELPSPRASFVEPSETNDTSPPPLPPVPQLAVPQQSAPAELEDSPWAMEDESIEAPEVTEPPLVEVEPLVEAEAIFDARPIVEAAPLVEAEPLTNAGSLVPSAPPSDDPFPTDSPAAAEGNEAKAVAGIDADNPFADLGLSGDKSKPPSGDAQVSLSSGGGVSGSVDSPRGVPEDSGDIFVFDALPPVPRPANEEADIFDLHIEGEDNLVEDEAPVEVEAPVEDEALVDPEQPAEELRAEDSSSVQLEAELTPAASADVDADAVGEETSTLGVLYLEQGHHQEARRIFEQVLARDPNNVQAQEGLAEVEAIKLRRADELVSSAVKALNEDLLGLDAEDSGATNAPAANALVSTPSAPAAVAKIGDAGPHAPQSLGELGPEPVEIAPEEVPASATDAEPIRVETTSGRGGRADSTGLSLTAAHLLADLDASDVGLTTRKEHLLKRYLRVLRGSSETNSRP